MILSRILEKVVESKSVDLTSQSFSVTLKLHPNIPPIPIRNRIMQNERYSLDQLAKQLGRDRREVEKLAKRGRIPGRHINGVWEFHSTEIVQWLEREMREYSDKELRTVEDSHMNEEELESSPIISRLLSIETMAVPLDARTKRSVLENLVEVAGRTWHVWTPAKVLEQVKEREEIHSTGFANGVAIPHPRNPLPDALGESVIAYGRTLTGLPFGAPKRAMTDLFFLVLTRDPQTHLIALARLGRLLQIPNFVDELRAQPDAHSSYEFICDTEEKLLDSLA